MAFRGLTARVPVGLQGFNGSKNTSQMQAGHLKGVEGVSLQGGVLQKDGGAQKLNASQLTGGVLGGVSWDVSDVLTYDIVCLTDGTVRRGQSGVFDTVLKSGLNVGLAPVSFAAGGGEAVGSPPRLYLFTGTDQVQIMDVGATAFSNISAPPADWATSFPTFGVQHVQRLWAGGNPSDPHRIYYSTLGSHQTFTGAGAGTLPIYPGEGRKLVAAVSFRNALVLFKYPKGIYIVNTDDPSPANWRVTKLTRAVGSISQNTVVEINNDIAYLDSIGNIHLISATNTFGDMESSNLSRIAMIDVFVRENIALGQLGRAVGLWYPAKQELWFMLPSIGGLANEVRLSVDMSNAQMGSRFLLSRRDTARSAWLRPDSDGVPRPTIGDDIGFVWKLDDPILTKAGDGYIMEFETADTDLSFVDGKLAYMAKNFEFLELVSEPKGSWSLTVEVWIDDYLTDTLNFDMGIGGSAIGSFAIGTSKLGSIVPRSDRKKINGSGRRIRLVGRNTGAGQDVSLAEFFVAFTMGDERVRTLS